MATAEIEGPSTGRPFRSVSRNRQPTPHSKEDPREAKARDRAENQHTRANPRAHHLAQARLPARLRFPTKPDTPRPSEPILVPKLRINFADFPYLHYSID